MVEALLNIALRSLVGRSINQASKPIAWGHLQLAKHARKSIAPDSASQIDVLVCRLPGSKLGSKARKRESLLFLRKLISLQSRCPFLTLRCHYNGPRHCWVWASYLALIGLTFITPMWKALHLSS